ncbi:pre-toxin TG domain-containing protein [Cohnella panacarvi]|uniref:pre-toxin TG domain-containing protein n=1 Tax=Cohnella panacarvi TaxID=400776 RepID=UPI00047CE051|nr:pre-toxin TG domain-containing protein [Cohnella panacarvi]
MAAERDILNFIIPQNDSIGPLSIPNCQTNRKRFTEQAKANAVPPANSCPAPEEPIDYRAYLGEYDRETPGVDALYFIDADGNRMQVDFSKLEQLVGEYYYVSNLILISGFVLDERESDYTDFFIYAIKQGYDPRTFQPIDAAEAENIQNYINGRVQTYEMYRQKQKVMGSLALDLLPIIGQVKSAIELATGENLVTGEELNGWDYGFGIAGAIAPAIKGGRGLYKGYKGLSGVDEVVDVGRVIEGTRGLDPKIVSEILATDKGLRPNPSNYLPKEYIDNHLALFDGGVTKIQAAAPTRPLGPPSGTFVMPKSVADVLISESGGNVSKLEELLSLDPGTLGKSPVRVDIPKPAGLRMPDGNEVGANDQWIPGGYTGGGIPEAIIDQVPLDNLNVTEIIK